MMSDHRRELTIISTAVAAISIALGIMLAAMYQGNGLAVATAVAVSLQNTGTFLACRQFSAYGQRRLGRPANKSLDCCRPSYLCARAGVGTAFQLAQCFTIGRHCC